MNCKDCPWYNLDKPKVEYEGNCQGIYLVGMAPADWEIRAKRPFVGRAGQLLRQSLKAVFGDEFSFRFANACKCYVKAGQPLPQEVANYCSEYYLFNDIKKNQPKVIITFGQDAFNALYHKELPILKTSISDIVEMPCWHREFNCWVIPNFHPSYILRNGRDKGVLRRFLNSLLLAKRLLNEKPYHIPDTQPILQYNYLDIIETIKKAVKSDIVTFDFETYKTRPFDNDAKLATISLAFDNKCYSFPYEWPEFFKENEIIAIKEWLKKLWTANNVIKVAHNILFESEWVYDRFGIVLQEPVADTMVLHHGLYAGQLSAHGLKFIAIAQYGVKPWAIDVRNVLEQSLEKVLYYNALDSYYTHHIYKDLTNKYLECKQEKSKRGQERWHYYRLLNKILMPLIPYVAKAQTDGIPISIDHIDNFEKEFISTIKECLYKIYTDKKLLEFSPKTKEIIELANAYSGKEIGNFLFNVLIEKKDKKILKQIFNINSSKQLADFILFCGGKLEKSPKGNYIVDEEALKNHTNIKVIANLLELRRVYKKYNTYVKGSRKFMWPDGKFHPEYQIIGNNTSRFMCAKPNMQNFPKRKGKEMRNIIKAPDGYVIISSDFSNLEVRGEAIMSSDKKLIEFLQTGADQHLYWSERLFGKSKAKEMRNKAKNGFVFPIQYGAGVKTLCKGVGWPLDDNHIKKMQKILDTYWETHKGIYERHKKAEADYNKYGEIYDMCGRVRKAPLKYNMIINYGIQSSCFYLTMNAWLYLLRKGYWSPIEIHDEIVVIVKDDEKSIAQAVKDIWYGMITLNKKTFSKIKNATVEIGCDMKKGKYFGFLEPFDFEKYLEGKNELEG